MLVQSRGEPLRAPDLVPIYQHISNISVTFSKTKQFKNIDTFYTNKKLNLNKIPLVCFIVINLFVVVGLIYVIDTWHQDVFVRTVWCGTSAAVLSDFWVCQWTLGPSVFRKSMG
jgi:hypothetical protein